MSVAPGILGDMAFPVDTSLTTVPAWTVPPWNAIKDLHWTAYGAIERGRKPDADAQDRELARWALGVTSTLAWLRAARVQAPVTERADQPITRELAVCEHWAAFVTGTDPDGLLDGPRLASEVDVPWQPPVVVQPDYGRGTWCALRWLLGYAGQGVPLPVPERNDDGSLVTETQMYERAKAEEPGRYRNPERRQELRHDARRQARRNENLAARIEQTQEHWAVSEGVL